jgi:hypothetical protein
MPFDIRIDAEDNIVEVIYPPNPTAHDVADYVGRMKAIIVAQRPGWKCLVDQRALQVMSPELVKELVVLNVLAETGGMARTARLVATAISTLQATRIKSEARLGVPARSFSHREAALAWLTEPDAEE